eukprot:6554132-Ditylum_brightwellii.AAC.1
MMMCTIFNGILEDDNHDTRMATSTLLASQMATKVTCILSQIRGSLPWGLIFEPPRSHGNVYHSSSPHRNHHQQSNDYEWITVTSAARRLLVGNCFEAVHFTLFPSLPLLVG